MRDLSIADGRRLIAGLQQLPDQIESVLAQEETLAALAGRLAAAESLFFVGRVRGFGRGARALRFRRFSYRHAGRTRPPRTKHGPLALIALEVPTVAIVPDDNLTGRNVAALHEIAAAPDRWSSSP